MSTDMSSVEARELLDARLEDSIYMDGVTAGWNAAQADDPSAAMARIQAAYSRNLSENNEDLKAARALIAKASESPAKHEMGAERSVARQKEPQ